MTTDERARARAWMRANGLLEYNEYTHEELETGLLDELEKLLREERRRVWDGLKLTNEQLAWALRELGPTGTQAEAYIKATVQYVMTVRQQAREEEP